MSALDAVNSMLDTAVAELPADELPALIGLLAAADARARARLAVPQPATTMDLSNLTAEQIAAEFGVPTSEIYALARQQRLPCVKIGKYVRFSLSQVRAALEARESFKPVRLGTRKNRHPPKQLANAATVLQPLGGVR